MIEGYCPARALITKIVRITLFVILSPMGEESRSFASLRMTE
jgi:hypothetical protein